MYNLKTQKLHILLPVLASLLGWGGMQAMATEIVFPPPPDEPRFYYEKSIYSSKDVAPAKKRGLLEQLAGGLDEDVKPLVKPYAVAARKGKIYVSDSADATVHVFDMPNKKYSRIGEGDEGAAIGKALGIDLDERGNLYVADVTAKTIKVYDDTGRFLRNIGDSKILGSRMASVSVNPEGSRVYVTEIGGVSSDNHRIVVFDAVTGSHLFNIGKRGDGPGQFNLPRDVAIGKDGRIYVVDGGNFRVQIFDKEGKYIKSFGQVGRYPGNFSRPKEIAIDKQGNVYVVDTAFGNFQIFDAEGQLLMFVGMRSEQDGPAKYMLPSGIAIDEDGRVYFVDQWFRKVEIYRPVGLGANQGVLMAKPLASPGK